MSTRVFNYPRVRVLSSNRVLKNNLFLRFMQSGAKKRILYTGSEDGAILKKIIFYYKNKMVYVM